MLKKALFGAVGVGGAAAYYTRQQAPPYNAALRGDIQNTLDNTDPPIGPEYVRLAWHASGTYHKKNKDGGNHGTMDNAPERDEGANAGLGRARGELAPLFANHSISKADLWVLASLISIEEMGGPKIPFYYGRVDGKQCPPVGRLPDASKGSDHIRAVFTDAMGFNDREIVALMGAHALGRCNKDRSGYFGPWTNDPYGFSNSFFTELKEKTWQINPETRGSPNEQYEDKETKKLMMLPTDMVMLTDPSFRKFVDIYAEDDDVFFEDFSKVWSGGFFFCTCKSEA